MSVRPKIAFRISSLILAVIGNGLFLHEGTNHFLCIVAPVP